MSEVTLFVLHWNRPAECLATVRALLEQKSDLKVVVVDNDSSGENYEEVHRSLNGRATFVRLSENKGWGGALNVVLKSWLDEPDDNACCLISAHDTQPHDRCVDLLLKAAALDPRIGIACPQYPDSFLARLSRWRGVFPETVEPRACGVAQEVDVPHGTLMLLRRGCLRDIGLFDERYFAYGDEHELGARARLRGWKIALVWGAIVVNPGTWTAGTLRSYLFARNSLLLVHDQFGRMAAWLRTVLLLANTVRHLIFREEKFAVVCARLRGVRDYFLGRFGKPSLR